MKRIASKIMLPAFGAALAVIAGCGQVDTGEAGFLVRWGEIVSKEPLGEGLYFFCPVGTQLVSYDCRNTVAKFRTEVFTKDIQSATIDLSVTFALIREKVLELHKQTGREYTQKLVSPAILGALKNIVGQMEADELIAKREDVANHMAASLSQKLKPYGISISLVEVLNIDYSDTFERAVEQKQVAMQEAIKERNNTQRLKEVASQQVVKAEAAAKAKELDAEAEAKAILVKAEAEAKSIEMRNKALAASHALIEYETVKTWDGKLPVQMLGSAPLPFISIPSSEPKEEQ